MCACANYLDDQQGKTKELSIKGIVVRRGRKPFNDSV